MNRLKVLVVCGIALASCMGCEMLASPFESHETVTIVLPEPHPAVLLAAASRSATVRPQAGQSQGDDQTAYRPSWTIRWRTPSGAVSEIRGITDDVDIGLERGRFTAILVIPETDAAGIPDGPFPCAGALYPLHAGNRGRKTTLAASWERGLAAVCAEAVLTCAGGGYESGYAVASRFNWNRFIRTASALPDPGALDLPRIAEAILSGSVSVRDIREKQRAEVPLAAADLRPAGVAVSAGSVFIPVWPGAQAFVWPDDGKAILSAPEGFSRYFSTAGFLAVEVKNGIAACAFFGKYGLPD